MILGETTHSPKLVQSLILLGPRLMPTLDTKPVLLLQTSKFRVKKLVEVKRTPSQKTGFRPVEILHVDTAGSRELYSNRSPIEKAECAKLLKQFFAGICAENGGRVSQWEGDGGFALFPSSKSKEVGSAVRAGAKFLEELPSQNAQTARAMVWPAFPRRVRIKAHRGEVYLANERGLDSADAQHFDDFLKHERKFAPKTDELFVTEALYHVLVQQEKNRFKLFSKSLRAGVLQTRLYRLRRMPVNKAEDIFQRGDQVSTITQADWTYLRNQIAAHFANVAARNQITKGLIAKLNALPAKRGLNITSDMIFELTLDAIFSYLRIVFNGSRIRVSYWRAVQEHNQRVLKMVNFRYPEGESTNTSKRVLNADDMRYKICECYATGEPVVTPCVTEARNEKAWEDFDKQQTSNRRALDSALQIPVYYERTGKSKDIRGILSLDADRPDMFLPEELALWRDDLVGFLANLALAEKLRERSA